MIAMDGIPSARRHDRASISKGRATLRAVLVAAATLSAAACSGGSSPAPSPGPQYPATPSGEAATTHFGQRVADPYRWLEDTRSPAVVDWVAAQNAFSAEYVQDQPIYSPILKRLEALADGKWAPEPTATRSVLRVIGREGLRQVGQQRQGLYYYQWQELGRDQRGVDDGRRRPAGMAGLPPGKPRDNRIYVSGGQGQEGRVLLDVGRLAQEELDDNIELKHLQVSKDGNFLVYGLNRNYADLEELWLFDLQVVDSDPRVLTRSLSNESFFFEGDALLYVEAQGVTEPWKSSYGTQAIMRLDLSSAKATPSALYTTDSTRPASVDLSGVMSNKLYFHRSFDATTQDVLRVDLVAGGSAETVLDGAGSIYFRIVDSTKDGQLLVLTSSGAAMYRLVRIDPKSPEVVNWTNILPPKGATDVVSEVRVCGQYAYAVRWVNGENLLDRYALADGAERKEIPLPAPGAIDVHRTVMKCGETVGEIDNGEIDNLDYQHSTLAQPKQAYAYDAKSGETKKYSVLTYTGHDPRNYTVSQPTVPAADGEPIPITLAHRKGLALDGKAPALMYVYGGFMTPTAASFDANVLPLLEAGGVYVVAHVRGGAERGTAWYDAGRSLKKRTTYSDLADVARYLVAKGYTSAARLGVQGWSNGGTSSAAAALLYPELFAVALPRVGVHDLTRYTSFTSGFSWTRDYGNPAVEAEFANLMTFSPLHSVKARRYPAMYVLTGQDDQRVLPGHSYKLAAALQNTATGPGPYLLHSFAKSGHGIDGEQQRSEAHALTFFFIQTGTPFPGPQ
jgi:prolyl oligopeptidase